MSLATTLISALLLVAGAAICLIASVGVLRLPDFFMRMHAATKAGVVGAGLVLLGVAVAVPGWGMVVKVLLAIVFLLLTTPIAGHLLARAGYVAGVPLWGGTREDRLARELPRGDFERGPAPAAQAPLHRVVLGLAHGPGMDDALTQALTLARQHGAELLGLGIVDTPLLSRVGPVPIGGAHYAAQLRNTRIARARHRLAEVVQSFEQAAAGGGLPAAVQVEEGEPVALLQACLEPGVALVLPQGAWFDHGVGDRRVQPAARLARHGLQLARVGSGGPLVVVAASP